MGGTGITSLLGGNKSDVIIFDSDASNPYSEELYGVLTTGGIKAEFVGPSDNHLTIHQNSLRPRFSRVTGRDLVRELFVVLRLIMKLSWRKPIIIVWARPYQKAIFGLYAFLRTNSVIYIVHNPVKSRWPTGIRNRVEDLLLRSARPVVHSESLRLELLKFGPFQAAVVAHPPYLAWVERIGASHVRRDTKEGGLNLVILGRLEPDKFRSLPTLIQALDAVPGPATLRMLVRPSVGRLPSTSRLTLDDRSRDQWIDDAEMADGLKWADVLLAPYEAVTESGTVQLALTLGVRVVAFSGGALDQSLVPEALADVGDYLGLVKAITEVTKSTSPTSRWSPRARSEDCLKGWTSLLASVP